MKDKFKNENLEEIESDVIEVVESDVIEQFNPPVEIKNLTVKVIDHANLRPYPNHTSTKVKMFKAGVELEVLDIVEGSLVQGGNTWYKVEGGFVHFSQVKEV